MYTQDACNLSQQLYFVKIFDVTCSNISNSYYHLWASLILPLHKLVLFTINKKIQKCYSTPLMQHATKCKLIFFWASKGKKFKYNTNLFIPYMYFTFTLSYLYILHNKCSTNWVFIQRFVCKNKPTKKKKKKFDQWTNIRNL